MIGFGLAILLVAISGLPGLFLRTRGGPIAAGLMILGTLAGLWAAGGVLFGGGGSSLVLPATPLGAAGLVRLDPIAAFFLVPVLVLPTCGAVFGLGYWSDQHANARRLRLLFGLTTAFLALLVAAGQALTFLLAWEGMATTAFFLVLTEDRLAATRRAGWLYLVATHSGTLCLFAGFALLAAAGGTLLLAPVAPGFAATDRGTAMFLLFLVGFGLKAGLMPFHFWLPEAHAAAPSHVSSMMSGIFIKMGILGLIRILTLVPDPPLWWGGLLVALGAVSGILGVAFALGQHDLKRLLAYHSIENIGIIFLGLGLGLLGKALGNPVMMILGFAGGLLHVLNHSLFKGLLFLGAGAVVHATGTRELDRLGGLSRAMPFTAGTFLVGSWAICGLPPLNGFVGEWLIYLAAFRGLSLAHSAWPALALGALALIGALAVACFAKVFGTVFLGTARSRDADGAREAPRSMRAPMAILAGACIVLGLLPFLLAPVLLRVAQAASGRPAALAVADLGRLWILSVLALPLLALAALGWRWARRGAAPRADLPTWDCGFPLASARVQYTASSFAAGLVSGLSLALWPRIHWRRVTGLFPSARRFHSEVPDAILDRLLTPGVATAARGLTLLRFFQNGQLQLYLLYVVLTLLVILWMVA